MSKKLIYILSILFIFIFLIFTLPSKCQALTYNVGSLARKSFDEAVELKWDSTTDYIGIGGINTYNTENCVETNAQSDAKTFTALQLIAIIDVESDGTATIIHDNKPKVAMNSNIGANKKAAFLAWRCLENKESGKSYGYCNSWAWIIERCGWKEAIRNAAGFTFGDGLNAASTWAMENRW